MNTKILEFLLRNIGAERPYVVKNGGRYTVIEGNTRIAAYKLLAGIEKAPKSVINIVPQVSSEFKSALKLIDCTVAPSRDALLPIVANAHFGLGDKSRWGYLGSRKAVYDEWKSGKSPSELAKIFDRTDGQIRELILEYLLYLESLKLSWTQAERDALLVPSIQFNPPVRFLETTGHKQKVGISYDSTNLLVNFESLEAKSKFKHLINKLVVSPQKGLGATATYDDVFVDYNSQDPVLPPSPQMGAGATTSSGGTGTTATSATGVPAASSVSATTATTASITPTLKNHALFNYPVTMNNALIKQLMREAKEINCKNLPAAGNFLLRNMIESILKEIIDQQKSNPASKVLDLEGSLNLCMNNAVSLTPTDKKILKQFHKDHLSYLNLGAHGNVIPNRDRLMAARDCIDQFVKKNV